MAVVRLTGEVLHSRVRSGTSKAGNEYSIAETRILVGGLDTATVSSNPNEFQPQRGEPVDIAVEASGNNFGLRLSYLDKWTDAA